MKAQRHTQLVKAVRRLLAGYGCLEFPVKQLATPRRGRDGATVWTRGQLRPGVPDVCACGPRGQFVGVECKIGRDALRPEQAAFGQEILRRGGVWLVARDTVDTVIKARRQITQNEE